MQHKLTDATEELNRVVCRLMMALDTVSYASAVEGTIYELSVDSVAHRRHDLETAWQQLYEFVKTDGQWAQLEPSEESEIRLGYAVLQRKWISDELMLAVRPTTSIGKPSKKLFPGLMPAA